MPDDAESVPSDSESESVPSTNPVVSTYSRVGVDKSTAPDYGHVVQQSGFTKTDQDYTYPEVEEFPENPAHALVAKEEAPPVGAGRDHARFYGPPLPLTPTIVANSHGPNPVGMNPNRPLPKDDKNVGSPNPKVENSHLS